MVCTVSNQRVRQALRLSRVENAVGLQWLAQGQHANGCKEERKHVMQSYACSLNTSDS